ncbi:MAG: ABC transporter permease subunit [Streptosporangiaceae bacterium]
MSGLKRASGTPLSAMLVVAVVIIAAGFALSSYWQYVGAIGAAEAIFGLSIGLVYGQAGMLSLCQPAIGAIGAWTVAYLSGEMGWVPLPWSLFIGAIIAVPIGLAAGMPALRLRRVNLAIVTLGVVIVIYTVAQAGQVAGSQESAYVKTPTWNLAGYMGLYLLGWLSFTLLAALTIVLRRSRWGLSWLAIARSERAAAAMGVSVTRAKLTAFAVAAFLAAWAGGLLVAGFGSADPSNFDPVVVLTLFALAVMMGAGYWEGALALGLFSAISSALLEQWGLTPDLGTALFAIGAITVLGKPDAAFSVMIRRQVAKLSSRRRRAADDEPPALRTFSPVVAEVPATGSADDPGRPLALAISNLTVNFGAVRALDDVSLTVPYGEVVGLVGPNGAGKSTLVDATTGFLAAYSGTVQVDGAQIDALPAYKRARIVRRTFQQDRTIGELTAEGYLRLGAAPGTTAKQIQEIIEFVGCSNTRTPLHSLDVRLRRLLMIGACLTGRPKTVLVDEPAAGLSAEESIDLAARLAEIPERFGCGLLVIEHDMELVRLLCTSLVVLDFGKVIAFGPTAEVLARADVAAAYLGDDVAAETLLEETAVEETSGETAPAAAASSQQAGGPRGR